MADSTRLDRVPASAERVHTVRGPQGVDAVAEVEPQLDEARRQGQADKITCRRGKNKSLISLIEKTAPSIKACGERHDFLKLIKCFEQ